MGIDTDPALLAELDVECRDGVRFDGVVGLSERPGSPRCSTGRCSATSAS